MTQPSLFSKVPPTVARARRKGHAGADRAGQAAGEPWMLVAVAMVLLWARRQSAPWLLEDAREGTRPWILTAPPDPRAWGAVIQRLKRAGRIRAVGYAPARSSHGSAKTIWEVVR